MEKKNRIKERREKVSQDVKDSVELSMSTVNEIYKIMDELGISQRELAERLKKHESEISKWLSGTHNFTYQTIGKIQSALGRKIITTVSQAESVILYFNPITVAQNNKFSLTINEEGLKREIKKSCDPGTVISSVNENPLLLNDSILN